MNIRSAAAGAAAILALAFATSASATTVLFDFSAGFEDAASGYFSYPTGDTGDNGVIGLGDLTDFSLTIFGETYDLADLIGMTNYVHFGYDIADNSFTLGRFEGYQSYLSGLNRTGTFGFFFSQDGGFEEYQNHSGGGFSTLALDPEVDVEGGGGGVLSAVPEPNAWLLTIVGMLGLGAALRASRAMRGSPPAAPGVSPGLAPARSRSVSGTPSATRPTDR